MPQCTKTALRQNTPRRPQGFRGWAGGASRLDAQGWGLAGGGRTWSCSCARVAPPKECPQLTMVASSRSSPLHPPHSRAGLKNAHARASRGSRGTGAELARDGRWQGSSRRPCVWPHSRDCVREELSHAGEGAHEGGQQRGCQESRRCNSQASGGRRPGHCDCTARGRGQAVRRASSRGRARVGPAEKGAGMDRGRGSREGGAPQEAGAALTACRGRRGGHGAGAGCRLRRRGSAHVERRLRVRLRAPLRVHRR